LGRDAIQEKLQHLDVAGLRYFDCLADQLFFFALEQRFGDRRHSVFRTWLSPAVPFRKRTTRESGHGMFVEAMLFLVLPSSSSGWI
jgi:hypothetical protein